MTLTSFSRSQEGSDCWKMAFLHLISRMNGWILTKLVQLYCWERDKEWLDFGDLGPIFKVTGGVRFLVNGLIAPYLQNEWMDFDLYSYVVVTWKRTDQILMTLTPFSRSHKGLDCWKMVCLHPISWRNGWILTKFAQLYCCDMWKRTDYIFVTLTPFSKSQEGSDCWKMAFLHPISRMNGWILTKLVQLYCWDRYKN